MAEQRLSKLQKWILINCYKVTILKQLEDTTIVRCRYYNKEKCTEYTTPHKSIKHAYICVKKPEVNDYTDCLAFQFTQFEIYYYYFKLKLSEQKTSNDYTIYFEHNQDSEKVYISTSRSLKNLCKKDLINCYKIDRTKIIVLTDFGVKTAKRLLEIESI